jgi:hypothetical protein
MRPQLISAILIGILYELSQIVNWCNLCFICSILKKRRFMILYAGSRSYSTLFPNLLSTKRTIAYLQLMVATSHMRLFEFSLQRRASMDTFMTVHRWILSIVLVTYWCTQVGLATVRGEQWNNWLGTDIGEIWRWLQGPISSDLCPSPLLWLWRGIPNLKLPPAI